MLEFLDHGGVGEGTGDGESHGGGIDKGVGQTLVKLLEI